MMLTHICPNCKKPHEMAVTPEPDHLCPECEEKLMWKNSARLIIDFDAGNCPMKKEEGRWLETKIRECVAEMHINVEKVEWHGLD